MNFALLGGDADVRPLIRAIAAHRDHELTHAALADADTLAEVMKLAPAVQLCDRWDTLLLDDALDAVLVAGAEQNVRDGAKQLAAAGKSLLVCPKWDQGSAWVYELTLIRDDTSAVFFPLFALRVDPAIRRLLETIDEGSLGKLLHLELERALRVGRESDAVPLLTPAQADEALLADVDLLRSLGGDYNRVTALHSGRTPQGVSLASVSLAGDGQPEASWSLKATCDAPKWRLKATGENGEVTVDGSASARSTLAADPPAVAATEALDDVDEGAALLACFENAAAGRPISPDWTDLTRATEIVEASHRSLRRGRTIDLFFETTSERSLFKTQMTAVGCGLLTFTLFAVLFVLLLASLFDPRKSIEIQAERSDSIITVDEFIQRSEQPTAAGGGHIADIGARMEQTNFPVLIERCMENGDGQLDVRRRNRVLELLQEQGAADAEERTIVVETRGNLFGKVMQIARFLVFLPLFAFLLLQLLLFVARPSADQPTATNDE